MRQSTLILAILASTGFLVVPASSAENDALAIAANILANHLPFGASLDPTSPPPPSNPRSQQSRDSLQSQATTDWPAAWCPPTGSSPPGIESEESANTINMNPPWVWVDSTSRDEVIGVFFGLAAAYDFVNYPGVRSSISPIAGLIARYISDHLWSPDNDVTTTLLVRPEELQMLLDTDRHVDPDDNIRGPFINPVPFDTGVLLDIQDNSAYSKFNLDYMTFFNLVRYNPGTRTLSSTYSTTLRAAPITSISRFVRCSTSGCCGRNAISISTTARS